MRSFLISLLVIVSTALITALINDYKFFLPKRLKIYEEYRRFTYEKDGIETDTETYMSKKSSTIFLTDIETYIKGHKLKNYVIATWILHNSYLKAIDESMYVSPLTVTGKNGARIEGVTFHNNNIKSEKDNNGNFIIPMLFFNRKEKFRLTIVYSLPNNKTGDNDYLQWDGHIKDFEIISKKIEERFPQNKFLEVRLVDWQILIFLTFFVIDSFITNQILSLKNNPIFNFDLNKVLILIFNIVHLAAIESLISVISFYLMEEPENDCKILAWKWIIISFVLEIVVFCVQFMMKNSKGKEQQEGAMYEGQPLRGNDSVDS